MVSLPVYNRSGEKVGTYDIDPAELAPRISKQLLHEAVVMYQANMRQGTAQSKGRSDVAGTTKKMYRQKGTGNARAGSRRSNIRRGGGHSFAKRPRDWYFRLPKKAVKVATRMALASRLADNEVTLIDDLSFAQPKTKEMTALLAALVKGGGIATVTKVWDARVAKLDARKSGKKAPKAEGVDRKFSLIKALKLNKNALLVATTAGDANAYKSARNIAGVSVMPVADLNAYEVLRPRAVLMTRAALDAFRQKARSGLPATESQDSAE